MPPVTAALMEVQQGLGDAGVIGREGKRTAQSAVLAGKNLGNLLALGVPSRTSSDTEGGPATGGPDRRGAWIERTRGEAAEAGSSITAHRREWGRGS